MIKHVNIPIFIPHLGCPNQCVFCNQRTISGVERFDPTSVIKTIEDVLITVNDDTEVEIAFFGGSFTGIDRDLMIELLEIAGRYINNGSVNSLRCSTRPDYINKEVLDILSKYGMKTIELGLQSTSDKVLTASKRGHNFEDEKRACKLIVKEGFDLVGQMMIGLPESTVNDEIETAKFIIESGAVGARIYPTVVFKDTELCSLCENGFYNALSLDEAIERSAKVFRLFLDNSIEVIRIGLCSSENLSSDKYYYKGPNHPALGELVINRFYYDLIVSCIKNIEKYANKSVKISVAAGELSKAVGQRKKNKLLLEGMLNARRVVFMEDPSITKYSVHIEEALEDKNVLKIT